MQLQLTLTCTESNALFNYVGGGFNNIYNTIPFRKLELGKKVLLQEFALIHTWGIWNEKPFRTTVHSCDIWADRISCALLMGWHQRLIALNLRGR